MDERALRLAAFLDHTEEAVVAVGIDGTVLEWSPGAEVMFGFTRKEMLGAQIGKIQPSERSEEFSHNLTRVARGDRIPDFETERRRKDGTLVEVTMSVTPVRDAEGRVIAMWAVMHDATQRQRLLRHIGYLERAFAILEGVSHVSLRDRDLVGAYREACRLAVERGGLRMAWIGRVEKNGRVVPLAHEGHEAGYLASNEFSAQVAPRGAGPTGRSVRERRPAICSDVANDPTMAPWREAALARGYHSCAAIPILVGGEVAGTMAVYSSEVDFFTPGTVRLLTAIGNHLSLLAQLAEPAKVAA